MSDTPPLYGFQSDAVTQIALGNQVYLGFDPGLGKSRTAIHASRRRAARTVLILCPFIGKTVWEQQIALWAPGVPLTFINGPADLGKLRSPGFVLITYGLLSKKDSPFASAIAKGPGYDMTVLDEAHAVKNPGANRTKAILGKMLPKLGYVLPMSGTPAPNHAGELFSILKAVFPSAILNGSGHELRQWEFEERYCKIVRKRFAGREFRSIEGSKNLPELRQKMDGFMLRVKKEDVLKDLPPIRFDVVPLPVSLDTLPPMPVPPGLNDDDALLKWLSGATGDEAAMRIRHYLGLAKVEPAAIYIDEFLQGLPGKEKLLVFAHHRNVIENLVRGLGVWRPAVITGDTNKAGRDHAVSRFLEEKPSPDPTRLLIANIDAAGTGLTLVGPNCKCSNIIFVEATYSVGVNVQAASRIHRIGQKDGVVARFLTAHGTLDDRIQSILARKAQDFAQLFN